MMMEKQKKKELVGLYNVAVKAAEAAALDGEESEEKRCLEAMSRLKVFPVTFELLVHTQVAKRIRSLRKHSRKNIQNLASQLIAEWRSKIVKEKKAEKINKKKTEIPSAHNPLRDKIREQLYEGLCKVFDEAKEDFRCQVDACDVIRVAVSVETSLFKKWGRFNGTQKTKYLSLLFNIKNPSNPDFRRKVLLGKIKAEAVGDLSAREMVSDEMQHQFQEIETKALLRSVVGTVEKGTTDQFKCGRCGQRETAYCQLQTRSADEPMTTYVTCMRCNHHWKFC